MCTEQGEKRIEDSVSRRSVSRREFLRKGLTLAGLTATAAFLEACRRPGLGTVGGAADVPINLAPSPSPTSTSRPFATPAPSATPTPSPLATSAPSATPTLSPSPTTPPAVQAAGLARIAFVKTRDRAEGVRRALDLLDLNPVAGKQVLLKPNFNSPDPAPGSTHEDVLRTLIEALWDMHARSITLADRSGMADTRRAMQQKGVFRLAQELGFDTLVLDELEDKEWVMVRPSEGHWQAGFPFARPCREAEALIQTCCLKTHRFGGHFTMSLKNSVGMVAKYGPDGYDYMGELHSSPYQRLMIAEVNTAYMPALIVLDGVEAFVSGGPDAGKRVASEVMLVGTDRVALDAVGVALLRYWGTTPEVSQGPIFGQEQIARAVELGLGVDGPDKIELLTGDPDSQVYADQIRQVLMRG
jgi:uncharacterized protein (DUF362 family)